MKKRTNKFFPVLMSLLLTLTFSGIPESELTAAAAAKVNLASSSDSIQSYSVTKKSKNATKKTSKTKKSYAKKKATTKKTSAKKKSTTKKTSAKSESKTKVTPTPTPVITTSLADAYSDYFTMGVATPYYILCDSKTSSIVLKQFKTITMENETKPEQILDSTANKAHPDKYNTCPAIKTVNLENYLKYCQENGLKLRFHTLVWYSQTPRWFFMENYSDAKNAKLVSKDIMEQRMENYIRQIMECTKKYPDVIYAWDVVNEAIDPADKETNGYRTTNNYWYQILGEEYVEKAFTYAKKYAYDNAGMFYNDFNEYNEKKLDAIYNMLKPLKEKGLVDGMGMQSHISMILPYIQDYEAAIKKYASLGLEINVTELDITNDSNTSRSLKMLADRYKDIVGLLLKMKKEGSANITHVTIWGLRDCDSWLPSQHDYITQYPLLFDDNGTPKLAYYSLLDLVK